MSRAEKPRQTGRARPVWPMHPPHDHQRDGRPDETHLSQLSPAPIARLLLALMRWHFQTFAQPESQSWLMALRVASAHVGAAEAGALCYRVTALVQALRRARETPVAFNPEGCACCRVWVTPDERRLLALLDALRGHQSGQAVLHAQILCDGGRGDTLIAAAQALLEHATLRSPMISQT